MTVAAVNPSVFPPFYKKPTALCGDAHRHQGLPPRPDFSFAAATTAIPVGIGEFLPALRQYPIVFASGDTPFPMVVTGLVNGGNLFVNADGSWRSGAYVPGHLRQHPFILGPAQDGRNAPLIVDEARLVDARADASAIRLFNDDGSQTAVTEQAIKFCLGAHHEQERTMAFVHALREANLLTPGQAQINLPNGGAQTLQGFSVVNETAFRALDDAALRRWFNAGWLDMMTLQFASQQNWQILVDLYLEKNSRPLET